MDASERERMRRLEQYAHDSGTRLGRKVGFGTSGTVFETLRNSAIKAHDGTASYERERNTYLRLRRRGVREICGHRVPSLVEFSDALLVIEMTIVTPPFVLDFGASYVDERPDYTAEQIAEWEAECAERFEDDWSTVQLIRARLASYGIYYYDAHPGNVRFR
jgi:hypothetical protein